MASLKSKTKFALYVLLSIGTLLFGLSGYLAYTTILEHGNITPILQGVNAYINSITANNEFASGAIIAGLFGGIAYISRSVPSYIFEQIKKHSTTTLYLDSTTEVYHQIMKYFQSEGLSDLARTIRFDDKSSPHRFEETNDSTTTKQIGYGRQVFIFSNSFIVVNHYKEESSMGHNIKNFLEITKLGRSHVLFDELFKAVDKTKNKDVTVYYKWDVYDRDYMTEQPIQNIDNVIMSNLNKKLLQNTIDNFTSKEDWFRSHNIPYQLGILLYGPPGTGKTTLVRSIAGYLNKNIVFVDSFNGLVKAAQTEKECVIVVEEIDTLANGKRDRMGTSPNKTSDEDQPQQQEDSFSSAINDLKRENIGQLLTSLDGVISNHGRVIVMTTNHKDTLDDAILRPGRIDLKLEIGYLDNQMFKDMLNKFFDNVPYFDGIRAGVAPVEVQNDIINGLSVDQIIYKYKV